MVIPKMALLNHRLTAVVEGELPGTLQEAVSGPAGLMMASRVAMVIIMVIMATVAMVMVTAGMVMAMVGMEVQRCRRQRGDQAKASPPGELT